MKLLTAFSMFMSCCKTRLIDKKAAGWTGWNKLSEKHLQERLIKNMNNKDWVDVANLSMFLWAREWRLQKRRMEGKTDG